MSVVSREQFLARLADLLRRSGVEDADELPATIHPVDRFDEVRAHITGGRLIEAIKIYREITGLGLKESKDAVEALRDEMMYGSGPHVDLTPVEAAARAGQKIEAIVLYRNATGAGLKDAKDAVEAMIARIQRDG